MKADANDVCGVSSPMMTGWLKGKEDGDRQEASCEVGQQN